MREAAAAEGRQMYDLEHLKSAVLHVLTKLEQNNYYTDTNEIDFAEFLAHSIVKVQEIKGAVLHLLATDYLEDFTDGLKDEFIYKLTIAQKLLYKLLTST